MSDLRSALGRPYHGYHEQIQEKAAALAEAVIVNHPFLDGNKRTAVYLVEVLLRKSGYKLLAPDIEIFNAFIQVANGTLDYCGLRKWFEPRIGRLA